MNSRAHAFPLSFFIFFLLYIFFFLFFFFARVYAHIYTGAVFIHIRPRIPARAPMRTHTVDRARLPPRGICYLILSELVKMLLYVFLLFYFFVDSIYILIVSWFMMGRGWVAFPSFPVHIKRLKGKKIKPPQRGFTIILFSSIWFSENVHK